MSSPSPVKPTVAQIPVSSAYQARCLPRLLYVGDVPIEASFHGSALLYRLLQTYPTESLRVIEIGQSSSVPERRLKQVPYTFRPLENSRWLNTRFHRYASTWFSLRAALLSQMASEQVGGFQLDGVITVAHGYGWLAAARLANQRNVPLHLIIHDDWPRVAKLPSVFAAWLDRQFGRVYKQSASRLCVSAYMVENFKARYGVTGGVLYPLRSPDGPVFSAPPERLRQRGVGLTCGYGGSINSDGYARPLRLLAETLAKVGGRLLLFGPTNGEQARQLGLYRSNVEIRGMVSSAELINRLRKEADVLFVPMSFDSCDRENMMLSFPSKLTDYTTIGVPLLILGPEYCSAVRWARENPGVAEVVEGEDAGKLNESLTRLADPAVRYEMGSWALETGRRYFSHAAMESVFYGALAGKETRAC